MKIPSISAPSLVSRRRRTGEASRTYSDSSSLLGHFACGFEPSLDYHLGEASGPTTHGRVVITPNGTTRWRKEGEPGAAPRLVWSQSEDLVILEYVQAHGHDWKTLAERLSNRTPHAIRNRFHRLQAMALDSVEGPQELMLATGASMLLDPTVLMN